MASEKTLLILKPEVTIRRTAGVNVIKRLLEEPFEFFGMRRFRMSLSLAKAHYQEHITKPFFPWLVEYIRSGPVMSMIVQGEECVGGMRGLLGSTMVQDASPSTLRGKYGIWRGINVAHASDSVDRAQFEIALWKKQGGLDELHNSKFDLESYIDSWSHIATDYTVDLRNLSRELEAQKGKRESIEKQMRDLLHLECVGVDQGTIEAFLRSMIKNCLRQL